MSRQADQSAIFLASPLFWTIPCTVKTVSFVAFNRIEHVTHSSVAFFMIVSLPEDAAETICCSIDLLILAVSDYE